MWCQGSGPARADRAPTGAPAGAIQRGTGQAVGEAAAEHVRQLLTSTRPDPTLVVHRGEPLVVAGPDVTGEYAGALVVAGKDDIARQLPDSELSEQDLSRIAERRADTVANLGG